MKNFSIRTIVIFLLLCLGNNLFNASHKKNIVKYISKDISPAVDWNNVDRLKKSTINNSFVNIAIQGAISADQTITPGSTPAPLSITGQIGTIQWQTSNDNITFTDISGASGVTYAPGSLSVTTYYRVKLTEANGTITNTNTVIISMDTDGDGVADSVDLDDDNDGITDDTEICTMETISGSDMGLSNGEGQNGSSDISSKFSLPANTIVINYNNLHYSGGFFLYNTPSGGASTSTTNYSITSTRPFFIRLIHGGVIATDTEVDYFNIFTGQKFIPKFTPASGFTIVQDGNTSGFGDTVYGLQRNNTSTAWGIASGPGIAFQNGEPLNKVEFLAGTTDYIAGRAGYWFSICFPKDIDSDNVPDYLDLDSDGDGCPDAIEGGDNVTLSMLDNDNRIKVAANGTTTPVVVDAQGIPAVVNSGSSFNVDGQAQGQTANQAYTVNPAPVTGTASSDQTVTLGNTPAQLSITGQTGTIQWQSSTDRVTFTNISGATSATYSPGAISATTYYRVLVSSAGGCTVTSNIVTISLDTDGDGLADSTDLDDDNDGILDTTECDYCTTTNNPFANGNFEAPSVTTGYYQGAVPNWSTTATDGQIEIWQNNFLGVPSASGGQFAELNATQVSTLYQTFCVPVKGGTINWSVKHRGRNGIDVAEVRIGTSLTNYTTVQTMSDGNTAWGSYSGTYTLPANNSGTFYIMFNAISSANGTLTSGNLIDDVQITINPICLDSDNDGTPNITDLDSDGDGCPDALEGGDNITISMLDSNNRINVAANGTTTPVVVDAQGVPVVVNSGSAFNVDGQAQGQTIGQALIVNSLVGGTASSDQTVTLGNTPAQLSISGHSGNSVQWQSSTDRITFTNISGATSATYSPGAISATTYYRVVVTSAGGCTVTSNIVTISLDTDGDGLADSSDLDDDNDGILDTTECDYCTITNNPFANGSFEAPSITTGNYQGAVPNWSTTATDGRIEIWQNNFLGVPSASGGQFAELNATQVSTLYQTFCVPVKGGTINWSVKHRGRNGIDVAEVRIGTSLTNYTTVQTMSDGNTAWGSYSGTYTLPANNSGTFYIMFNAISSANGTLTSGNLIDDVQITINPICLDSDNDGTPNITDLDSDGDGCPDALEGGDNITISMLDSNNRIKVAANGTTTPVVVDAQGVPVVVNSGSAFNVDGQAQGQTVGAADDATLNACRCFKPGATDGDALPVNHGITVLGRSGNDGDGNAANDWPMVRKGAWTALEGKSKGFVINRVPTTAQVNAITNAVEGMMVYDEEADCLKIYTKDNAPATTYSWRCFNNQTCPDVL